MTTRRRAPLRALPRGAGLTDARHHQGPQTPSAGRDDDGGTERMTEPERRAELSPRTTKAFDLAADLAKQLITIATGVVAFTATIFASFKPLTTGPLLLLALRWGIYLLSMLCGRLTLRALATELQPRDPDPGHVPSIHAGRIP